MRSESHQRAIDQVAILFPYLTVTERLEWWDRLNCPLVELTIHMESSADAIRRLMAEKENGEDT